jgi:hypothetical protein
MNEPGGEVPQLNEVQGGTTQQPKEKFGKAKELATVLRNKLGSV